MNPNDLELHDAQILSWSVDVEKCTALVVVNAYESQASNSRAAMRISFTGVTDFSSFADFVSLADNARSGNVNYWKPREHGGTKTLLYMNDGCLVISSRDVIVEVLHPVTK